MLDMILFLLIATIGMAIFFIGISIGIGLIAEIIEIIVKMFYNTYDN